jgi:hypothetical protein
MSDAEIEDTNDNNHEDAPAAPPKERKAKVSPFLKALRDNQIAQAREALMQTVCERADNTIGSIFDALENDEAGDYIMLEIFKGMTIEELVRAAAPSILGAPSVPPASAPSDDEDDDLDDDNEFDDDGSLEGDEPEPAKPSRKRSSSKKKTKSSTTRKKAPPKKTSNKSSSASSGGGVSSEYQKKILACLKESKARNEESAMSGASIRTLIGGTDVEFRANMSALFEKGRVVKFGKARGTKYARAPRQKS